MTLVYTYTRKALGSVFPTDNSVMSNIVLYYKTLHAAIHVTSVILYKKKKKLNFLVITSTGIVFFFITRNLHYESYLMETNNMNRI